MTKDFELTVDVSEWVEWADKLEDTSLLEKHMLNAMDGSLDLLLMWITREYMSEEHGVNFGHLRGSFAKEIYGTPLDLQGEVATVLFYGWPVEEGRLPGKAPMEFIDGQWQAVPALKLWVKRKLGVPDAELDAVARLIALRIGRHGTKGVHMVQRAFDRARSGDEIARVWEYELEQFLRGLGK